MKKIIAAFLLSLGLFAINGHCSFNQNNTGKVFYPSRPIFFGLYNFSKYRDLSFRMGKDFTNLRIIHVGSKNK